VTFPGYLSAYSGLHTSPAEVTEVTEGQDGSDADGEGGGISQALGKLREGDKLQLEQVRALSRGLYGRRAGGAAL